MLTSARNLKSIKVIYMNASERSCYLFQKDIFYYAMTYCFEDIRV